MSSSAIYLAAGKEGAGVGTAGARGRALSAAGGVPATFPPDKGKKGTWAWMPSFMTRHVK